MKKILIFVLSWWMMCRILLLANDVNLYTDDIRTDETLIEFDRTKRTENYLQTGVISKKILVIPPLNDYSELNSYMDDEGYVNFIIESRAVGGKLNLFESETFRAHVQTGLHKWKKLIEEYADAPTNTFYGFGFHASLTENMYLSTAYESYYFDKEDKNYSVDFIYRF